MSSEAEDSRNPWWDPIGMWRRAGPVFADLSPPGLGGQVWNPLQAMFDGLRTSLIGRPVAFGAGESRIAFTLTSLQASVSQVAAAAGQVDDVSLDARDVTWKDVHFERASARPRNVHTRFRSRPVLVAAPVEVSAVLASGALNGLLAKVAPALSCEITASGDLRMRAANRPTWGYLQVLPAVEQGALVLRPTGVGRGARLWRLGRRVMPVRPRFDLPDGVRLTSVQLGPVSLEMHLRIDEWSFDSADLLALAGASVPPA